MKKVITLCLILGTFFCLCNLTFAKDDPSDGIIIKIKKDSIHEGEKILRGLSNIKSVEKLMVKSGDLYLVKTDVKNVSQVISTLNDNYAVEMAEPNYIYTIKPIEGKVWGVPYRNDDKNDIPNDPFFNKLWGLYNTGMNTASGFHIKGIAGADIDALNAWKITKGDRKVKIAVIDTGIDYNHPDLKDNMFVNLAELNGDASVDDDGNGYVDDIYGYDFANRDGDPFDDNKHGTHCAGTIGAVHNNDVGVAGVMSEVTLVPIKFLTGGGSGSLAHAIESIEYGIQMNVDIMSNSWGGGGYSDLLKEAIEKARDAGIIFIAAAGNSGTNNDSSPHYPSSYDVENVIAVAAYDMFDNLASFSCYGKKSVHVAAPGKDIYSTIPNNGYASLSGTSMATPHVSGIVGLLVSKEGRMDFTELKNRLMYSSVASPAYTTKVMSKGRVNAYNFLMNKITITPDPVPYDWQIFTLPEVFESTHPYEENASASKTYTIPGAKFIRVVIDRLELEDKYDFISVKNKDGIEIERITGTQEGKYVSEYVTGDTITLDFKTDYSVVKWGFVISTLEYSDKAN